MKIFANIHLLEISAPPASVFPLLMQDGDNLILVNTASPGQENALRSAIETAGFFLKDITHLIITCPEIDTLGCINHIKDFSPAVQIIASEDIAPYINGERTPPAVAYMQTNPALFPPEQLQSLKRAYENRRWAVARPIQPDQKIPLLGGIQTVQLGQHMCLYLPAERLLVAGCALDFSQNCFQLQNLPHSTSDTLSLEKLSTLEIRNIACFHSGFAQGDISQNLQNLRQN